LASDDPVAAALDDDDDDAADTSAPEKSASRAAADATTVRVPLAIQIAWIAIGVLLLVDHAYNADDDTWHSLWHPVTDALTLALVVFVLLGALINYVNEIGLPGGAKLTLRNERAAATLALDVSENYHEVAADLANRLQSWAEDGALLNDALDRYGTDGESISAIATRFCLERMEDAADLLSLDDEQPRLSVWWFFESEGGLRLLLSNEIRDQTTWDYLFEPFEGLMGQAFIECRQFNIPDVRSSSQFVEIRPDYPYRGVLLTPIVAGAGRKAVGIVSIDRTRPLAFNSVGENIGWAVASFIAQVYTHPTVRAALPELGL
jgi:hypothetical protein